MTDTTLTIRFDPKHSLWLESTTRALVDVFSHLVEEGELNPERMSDLVKITFRRDGDQMMACAEPQGPLLRLVASAAGWDQVLCPESNTPSESPPTKEDPPGDDPAGDDEKAEPADGGAGSDDPQPPEREGSELGPDDWVMKMRDWMEESGATVIRAASVLRVSDQTIRNLLNGKGPSPKTLKKLQEVFADYPPTVRFEPTGDPEVIGQLPAQPTPPQAAAYLQKTIATWMKSQSLDHDMAAHELSIKKKVLLNILQLKLPNPVVIGKIIRRIPELRPDHKPLLAARKMLENQRAKAA